jgi:predicted DNA-binding transcriptional regulator AlpA
MGEKVDSDDLVGAAEVAAILRLSHPSSVTTYLRRYADFPRPVVDLTSSRVRLWRRQDIERWDRDRTTAES